MVDNDRTTELIRKLETYLEQLKELQQVDKDEYLNNWKIYYQVDRCLHLTLETFLSIGEMVICDLGPKRPNRYTDIPKILCENKVIPYELSEKLIDLAKFRNVLVHDYLYLDHEKVYEHLQNVPAIITDFLNHIKNFIKKNIT